MRHKVKNIHFVGIGGVGMSGIAEVLHNLGYQVSGSDLHESVTTQRLNQLGIKVFLGHKPENVQDVDVVVISTAINKGNNPELVEAKAKKIPIVPRAMMLAELMRFRQGIAVAGTHGKTTTTSLVASILNEAHLDPTFVIGGKLNSADSNARLGSGEFLVAEADESDASFLYLSPMISIVTNIDEDHMETYRHDFEELKNTFVEFLQRLPFYGLAILCIDNPTVVEILDQVNRPTITYGFSEQADIRAVNIHHKEGRMYFDVLRPNSNEPLSVELNLPGLHNIQNALAGIAVATELNIPDSQIVSALRDFKGVGRRFQRYGEVQIPNFAGSFTLVDDYGHHPAEMEATLSAIRGAFPEKRLVLIFQPHRYSRTRDLFEDFVKVLSTVDVLILTEVYSAGEKPIVAADSRSLSRSVRVSGQVEPIFVEDIDNVPYMLLSQVQDNDLVITMGAGSIGQIPNKIISLAISLNQKYLLN